MSNNIIFAAAGNGKTYSICKKANECLSSSKKCILLISYTNEGVASLESEYRKQSGGVLDNRIVITSWYHFLLAELIKPYQCMLQLKYKHYKTEFDYPIRENFVSSFAFYAGEPERYFKQSHVQYFLNRAGDVVPDRASHLAITCNEHSNKAVISRLEGIYSHVFIDELQDYAGWDLEIIKLLFESSIDVLCVGDYKQATYRTNNSTKHSRYRDENIRQYFEQLSQRGLCSISYANTTRRFNQSICDFINAIHSDANAIVCPDISRPDDSEKNNIGVYLLDSKYLAAYCKAYHPVILRYDKRVNVGFTQECDVFNYGAAKGATYDRVLIIPVGTALPFIKNGTYITANQTRAKFYVACTRARHSVVIAVDNPSSFSSFIPCEIKVNNELLPAYKYSKNC